MNYLTHNAATQTSQAQRDAAKRAAMLAVIRASWNRDMDLPMMARDVERRRIQGEFLHFLATSDNPSLRAHPETSAAKAYLVTRIKYELSKEVSNVH